MLNILIPRVVVAISSAALLDVSDSGSLVAQADAPASSPEDLKQLDTLIDAVATLSNMLKGLKQGTEGGPQGDTTVEPKEDTASTESSQLSISV